MAGLKTRKKQRFLVLSTALVTLTGAVLLIVFALSGDSFALFRQPHQLVAQPLEDGARVRLGGMVAFDSFKRLDDGLTYQFRITDCEAAVMVEYKGFLPDLFREGEGVVTEGVLAPGGRLVADTVLAKHDENYVAKGSEVKNMMACDAGAETILYTGLPDSPAAGAPSR